MNSRLTMLTLLAFAVGGVLGISVIQYYFPSSGQTNMNDPILDKPEGKTEKG